MLLIQITAAHGPTECEHAARLTLRELLRCAEREGTGMQLLEETHTPVGCKSALLRVDAEFMPGWLGEWLGTIQWVFASPFRPHHPRKNWFVAVQRCEAPEELPAEGEITFQACRASGKGGQHVNTTDSAVHAIHVASGIAVKVMTERSQHANKRLARELIALKLAQRQEQGLQQSAHQRSQQHWQVERGSPVKLMRA
jgi:peptide chain release factor